MQIGSQCPCSAEAADVIVELQALQGQLVELSERLGQVDGTDLVSELKASRELAVEYVPWLVVVGIGVLAVAGLQGFWLVLRGKDSRNLW